MPSLSSSTAAAGFGQLLSQFRREKGITQISLAEKAHITPEHLCRIEKGGRSAPRLSTVERIVAALSLVQEERSQLLVAAGYGDTAPEDLLDVATRQSLERFLGESARGVGPSRPVPLPLSPLSRESLLSMPTSFRGVEAVVQSYVNLLRAAASTVPGRDGRVLLGLFGDTPLMEHAPELRLLISAGLRGAVEAGWNVSHLWRYGDDGRRRSIDLVSDLMQYLGFQGQYEPLVLQAEAGLSFSPSDFVVVPDVGALLLVSSSREAQPDGAILLTDPAAIGLLARHFDLLQSRARSLLTLFPPSRLESRRFDDALTQADEMDGDRFVAKDGLSTTLISPEVWRNRMERAVAGLPPSEGGFYRQRLSQILSNLARRRAALDLQLSTGRWRFLEMCPRSTILRLVRDGTMPKDDWLAGTLGAPPLTLEERRDVLNGVLQRLDCPSYELALLGRSEEYLARSYWIVKAGHAVFLESWKPATEGQEAVNLGITEPTMVRAFHAYFLALWDGLNRQDWEKRGVRQWLSRQVEQLQARIDAGES